MLEISAHSDMTFRLEGSLCYLVPFDVRHVEDERYIAWMRDYEVVKTINRLDYLRPVRISELREYCQRVMSSPNDIFLAVYEKEWEVFIGTIKCGHINWHTRTGDIGIVIGSRTHWGKGMATDALRVFCGYLFDSVGLRRLTGGLMGTNPAMLAVFKKIGFQIEGVLRAHDYFEGQPVDHICLGCFKEEWKLSADSYKRRGSTA